MKIRVNEASTKKRGYTIEFRDEDAAFQLAPEGLFELTNCVYENKDELIRDACSIMNDDAVLDAMGEETIEDVEDGYGYDPSTDVSLSYWYLFGNPDSLLRIKSKLIK